MAAYHTTKTTHQDQLSQKMESYLDWVVSDAFNRLIIQRGDAQEAIMLPKDEYERILSMSEAYEREHIAAIIKERVTHRKTPAKMVSHEEMMALLEKRRREKKSEDA